jgi:hypothetical protein
LKTLRKVAFGEDLNRCSPTKKFVIIGGIGVISSGFAGHLNGYGFSKNPLSGKESG